MSKPETLSASATGPNAVERGAAMAKWPESSSYFQPSTMDAAHARWLLEMDTVYQRPSSDNHQQFINIQLTDSGLIDDSDPQQSQPNHSCPRRSRHGDVSTIPGKLTRGTQLLFVQQERRYGRNHTYSNMQCSYNTWIKILTRFEIPPSALESLHDNNGCHGKQLSYCNGSDQGPSASAANKPCAYHLWIKLGGGPLERFLYARHDFQTGHDFVLVAGTDIYCHAQLLRERLKAAACRDLFSILLLILTAWHRELEQRRWLLDYKTQDIESRTGYSSLRFHTPEPLEGAQLSLTKDIGVAMGSLDVLIVEELNFRILLTFIKSELTAFARGPTTEPHPLPGIIPAKSLIDAFVYLQSQSTSQISQTRNLKARVEMQWNVIAALRNIYIADSARADNEVIRRISIISIIFLPATFLAAFFSMSFFDFHQADQGKGLQSVVSKWIWLYPACTVPLTIMFAVGYGLGQGWKGYARSAKAMAGRLSSSLLEVKDPDRLHYAFD